MAQGTRKPILISGAGIASLLFAQALRRASIPFLIFERDSSISFRAQGYRLRLSALGIEAVENVLDAADFQRFWDTCGKTGGAGFAGIEAISGEVQSFEAPASTKAESSSPRAPPEDLMSRDGKVVGIARGEMRKLFMLGCEPFIRWAHSVKGYRLTASGVRAVFADGSESEEGDMLVAGDGISSSVAKQVSEGKLKVYDTGARGIHGQAPTAAFKGLGEGVWRIADDSRPDGKVFLMTNVRSGDMENPDIEFGWTLGAQPGIIQIPNNDHTIIGKPAADIAKALTAKWHPRLQPLFDQMIESEAAFWKITCSTPTGVPEWRNEPRVTLLGDAVHSMTPAGGNGANTALRDSALLGRLVSEAGGFKDGLTAEYEKEMRVYASEAVRLSYGTGTQAFGVLINEDSPTL